MSNTSFESKLEYGLQPWGDLIYGTQGQLKALGLGWGIAYPNNDKAITVKDYRGFDAKIRLSGYKGDGIYSASILFPGRETPWSIKNRKWLDFSPIIKYRKELRADEYLATAEALIEAGLVRKEHIPGQPHTGRVRASVSPDGSLATGKTTSVYNKTNMAGAKVITKVSAKKYLLEIKVSQAEHEARDEAMTQSIKEWERNMATLSRPAPLSLNGAKIFIKSNYEKRHLLAKKDKKFQSFLTLITSKSKRRKSL